MGSSDAHSDASPTSTPPSRVRASSERTSFLSTPPTGSAHTISRAPGARPHASPKLGDEPPQRLPPTQVDLCGHQVRAGLDDRAECAERMRRARCLEPEQPSADDRSAHGPTPPARLLLDPSAQGRDVVEHAGNEHTGQVVARDGRHSRTQTRREDEVVVAPRPPARGGGRRVHPVDRHRRVAAHEPDHGIGPQRVVAERQVARPATRAAARERHAVIRRPRHFRQFREAPAPFGVPGAQRLDEPLGDHADDDPARPLEG